MSSSHSPTDSLLRHVIVEVARLPEEDLALVAEFVEKLEQVRQDEAGKHPRPSVAAIRAEARRLAAGLKGMPREQLLAGFMQVVEEIRAEAIAKGTAIDGEWEGD